MLILIKLETDCPYFPKVASVQGLQSFESARWHLLQLSFWTGKLELLGSAALFLLGCSRLQVPAGRGAEQISLNLIWQFSVSPLAWLDSNIPLFLSSVLTITTSPLVTLILPVWCARLCLSVREVFLQRFHRWLATLNCLSHQGALDRLNFQVMLTAFSSDESSSDSRLLSHDIVDCGADSLRGSVSKHVQH